MYIIVNILAPQGLCEAFHNVNEFHEYELRVSLTKLHIPRPKIEFQKNSLKFSVVKLWNISNTKRDT